MPTHNHTPVTEYALDGVLRQSEFIVIGGGIFGLVLSHCLFNPDKKHAHRFRVLEARST
ncbi:MAG TPA: FAD/NAD(P)-binding protein [Anaerolineae bacterium]